MAFYEDRVEHFGGALVLFKRNLAVAVPNAKTHHKPAWYMRLKIGGRKGYPSRQPHPSCPKAAHSDRSPASPQRPSSAYIVKRCKGGGSVVANSVYSKRAVGVRALWMLCWLLHESRVLCVRFWRENWRFVW
jgi:hypothetical protein